MPFGFLRRRGGPSREPEAARPGRGPATIPFDGMTEEWHLVGEMEAVGRLSDVLNKREPIPITNVRWAPIDGGADLTEAPGLKSIDPYDLILVLAGERSLPPLSESEKVAHKVHKVAYDVALELPPFQVIGTVFLYPGAEPNQLLSRGTEMFVPVVNAVATLGARTVSDPEVDAILVNRFYLRGVDQVDRRTGERYQQLPGPPLGGVGSPERSS